jgi:tripartite-type tricarboxylate transporter receptor subunit TctC
MGRNNKRHAFLAISLLIFAAFRTSGFAAEKIPFYQGKTLNIVINFAAGGPTDIESRIFARHLSRHIPGQPTITVQNMGGGGGLIAVNYIGEVAKPDGLTAAYFTGALFQQQIKDPALRVGSQQVRFYHGCPWRHGVIHSLRSGARHQEALGLRQGAKVSRRRSRGE